MIQGYTGQLDMWLARQPFEPTMIERLDALFAAGDCPDAIVVFVDAWTSFGGSQFLNSTGTGRYLDYLCDEVVRVRRRALPDGADRDHRGLTGKSSGGYGAMVVPMLRPDVFGALASHAGDALFEACYLPEFPKTRARCCATSSTARGTTFFERARTPTRRSGTGSHLLETYGYAAALLARPGAARAARCCRSTSTAAWSTTCGRSGWRRTRCGWRPPTPTRCARCAASTSTPAAATSTSSTSARRRSRAELDKLGVEHTLELFDGTHARLTYRYPGAIRELVLAIAP